MHELDSGRRPSPPPCTRPFKIRPHSPGLDSLILYSGPFTSVATDAAAFYVSLRRSVDVFFRRRSMFLSKWREEIEEVIKLYN